MIDHVAQAGSELRDTNTLHRIDPEVVIREVLAAGFVLDGQSAHRRRIKIGRRNSDQVEVLSGLAPGDRVIISDYATYDKIDRIDLTN